MPDKERFGRIKARHYDRSAIAHDHDGETAELHLGFAAVAQVSATPDGDGFLIRVWPPSGTHEYGGNNGTVLSTVVTFDAGCRPHIDHLHLTLDVGRE